MAGDTPVSGIPPARQDDIANAIRAAQEGLSLERVEDPPPPLPATPPTPTPPLRIIRRRRSVDLLDPK